MDGLENVKRPADAITPADIAQPSSEPATKKARGDEQGDEGAAALAMMMELANAAHSKSNSNDDDDYKENSDIDNELDDIVSDRPDTTPRVTRIIPRPNVQHWRVVEKDARQHCPVAGCSQYYVRYRNLEQHIISAHGAEHLKALDGPMEIDDSPKPFLCPAPGCGSRYVRKGDLKVHFLKKHKEMEMNFPELLRSKSSKSGKKHACPVPECNCGYMRFGDLRSHFMAHHKERLDDFPEMSGDGDVPSVCRVPNCSIRCSSEAALETHMRIFHSATATGQSMDATAVNPVEQMMKSSSQVPQLTAQMATSNPFANPMAFGFMNPMFMNPQMNPMFNPLLMQQMQQMQQIQQLQMQMQQQQPQMANSLLPPMNMLPGLMGTPFGFSSPQMPQVNQLSMAQTPSLTSSNNGLPAPASSAPVASSPFEQLLNGAMMPAFKTDMASSAPAVKPEGESLLGKLNPDASIPSQSIREMN